MSEHEARIPSDPTSDIPQSDLTEQVTIVEPDTTAPATPGEATAVIETLADESVDPQGSASVTETNLLEVDPSVGLEPAYAAPQVPQPDASAPPAYLPPTAPYGAPSAAYPQNTWETPVAAPYQAPPASGTPTGYPQQPAPPTYGAPQPPLTPGNERQIGSLAHGVAAAATVLSAGFLGFVAALVIYLMYKDRGPFVRANAAAALNVQITMGIGLIISGILMIVLIGLVTYPVVLVGGVVLHILGAVKAWNGEWWTPPLTIQFVK